MTVRNIFGKPVRAAKNIASQDIPETVKKAMEEKAGKAKRPKKQVEGIILEEAANDAATDGGL